VARPRAQRRDGFTASGSGPRLDDEFSKQGVPTFAPKHRVPPYMDPRVRRKQKSPEGGE